jgi:hypothetical protein
MIPIIGLMMGSYIFTRMWHLVGQKEVTWSTKLFASITILVAFVGTILLFTMGFTNPLSMK